VIVGSFPPTQTPVLFGHRRMVPRACIVDSKPHIRTFLADALEDIGFITQHCARAQDVATLLSDGPPDLFVLGLLTPESDVTKVLSTLASHHYAGKIMLFGGRASMALLALHNFGEGIGLAMLPPLRTPFRDSDLLENISSFLPIAPSPRIPVDIDEALRNGWLELWYQPKIDLQQMSLHGVEALARVRHPAWGVVPPSCFVPSEGDPRMRGLSEFVVRRAMADWTAFVARRPSIGMDIHLPLTILEDTDFIDRMCLELPDHAALGGLTVEISSVDFSREPELVRNAARQLRTYNVGISIDDVMAEVSWIDVADFPIAELQVGDAFIEGCAGDRDKRAVCGVIHSIAARLGARTTAKGIETAADFQAVSDMGFDFGEGLLFAKPMETDKFARVMLRGRSATPK